MSNVNPHETQKRINLLCIVGPTASGKTSLSIELAKILGGEVVSCDSMQIYRHMPIASAAPSEQEMQGVPHHMIGVLNSDESYSVARYCQAAHAVIADINSRSRLPILCGGTGLYYSSLVDNLEFLDVPADESLRSRLYARAEQEGGEVLLRELAEVDKHTAQTLHPNQTGRIVRALEIYLLSGRTLSEQNELSRRNCGRYNLCVLGLNYRNRDMLYDRINRRVDIMLDNGLLDEARLALANSNDTTAAQAIGHKELAAYIIGDATLAQSADSLKQATRRYAKRQLTWFRRDERVKWLYPDDYDNFEQLVNAAAGMISFA